MMQYILDAEGNPVEEKDIGAWAKWLESANRTIARDVVGPATVSTVFLGIDHRFGGEGPPLLFETLVFVPNEDGEPTSVNNSMRRYATKKDALANHEKIVTYLRGIKHT